MTSPISCFSWFPNNKYAGKHEALSCKIMLPFRYALLLVTSAFNEQANKFGRLLSSHQESSGLRSTSDTLSTVLAVGSKVCGSMGLMVLILTHRGCCVDGPSFSEASLILRASNVAHFRLRRALVNSD